MAWRSAGSAARSFVSAAARAPSLRPPPATLPRLRPSQSSLPRRRFTNPRFHHFLILIFQFEWLEIIVLLMTLYSYVYCKAWTFWGINPYFWIIENVHLLDWDMVFDGWIGTWESLDAHSLSCLCTTWWLQLDSSLTLISTCELSANSLTVPSNALVKIANYSPFVSFITLLRVHCGKEQPKLVSFFFSCSKFPVWTTVVYSCLGIKLDLVFFFW